ncbi:hypothetical protein TRFO_01031 [Tritrichomonas foetus]|uniref:Uncharacterized protein n=1 Tax=Tritrichomonas foetus TaxID=1144522 RepID=A0A1J4KN63_9EUKA|nr:hypothetical protein TRFO_01031 [Tritrichomonas foetus]|eukprot:OHT11142.1 hypothetical protein TRFO_01031 [Tritrichomonas foetus]
MQSNSKKKQSSLDCFFSKPHKTLQATSSPKKDVENELNLINRENPSFIGSSGSLLLNSRGSSPPPQLKSDNFSLNLANNIISHDPKVTGETLKMRSNERNNKNENSESTENAVLTPSIYIQNNETRSPSNKKYDIPDLSNEERNDLHFKLEVLEHRIQFGKDLDHLHPAMAPIVLKNEGLNEIRPREKTRSKYYNQIDYVQYLPEFWEPRCWDDEYVRMTHEQTEFLQKEMKEMPRKEDRMSIENDDFFDSSSSSSNSSSSVEYSSDDENSNYRNKNNNENDNCTEDRIMPRRRLRFNQMVPNVPSVKRQQPQQILRLSSLLFDTDLDDSWTDLEDF